MENNFLRNESTELNKPFFTHTWMCVSKFYEFQGNMVSRSFSKFLKLRFFLD
jgi:hypothetical protein